jgi:hypothetical protein
MTEWGSPAWVSEVESWIGEVTGVAVTVAHRETRPWSTLWTASTDSGTLWFKENCTPHRSEARLHAEIAALAPDHVDAPVAVEPARGWLLTKDGGTTMMDSAPGGSRGVEAPALVALLRDYATLQRLTIPHRNRLVAAGLRDASPLDAAKVAREQAKELAAYPDDDPRHLPADGYDRVMDALPALSEAGASLAAGAVPLAFDQADLFPRNVFLPRPGGPYRFFDLADAVWAHPFGSLVMIMVECLHRWDIPADDVIDCRDERVAAVLDAYLDCWTDLAPLPDLRRLAEYALRIAPLHRVAAWRRILRDADATTVSKHGRTPWAWLEDVTRPVRLAE